MKFLLHLFMLLFVSNAVSQEIVSEAITQKTETKVKIDSLYREDQFYFSFTYNLLKNNSLDLSQSKFSTGFSMGFLRDMPINKNRTQAVALGLGVSYNNYNQNLAITEVNDSRVYTLIGANTDYNKNKFSQVLIDVPLEFRWRNSTYESHKFYRIHGGIKFSYLVYDMSVFDGNQGKIVLNNNKDFNTFLYGIYVATGYNTWNVYAYYGLNPVFKSATSNNEKINMNALNIGLVFYIL
jgi:Outer membrane protein beta-barrel domain